MEVLQQDQSRVTTGVEQTVYSGGKKKEQPRKMK